MLFSYDVTWWICFSLEPDSVLLGHGRLLGCICMTIAGCINRRRENISAVGLIVVNWAKAVAIFVTVVQWECHGRRAKIWAEREVRLHVEIVAGEAIPLGIWCRIVVVFSKNIRSRLLVRITSHSESIDSRPLKNGRNRIVKRTMWIHLLTERLSYIFVDFGMVSSELFIYQCGAARVVISRTIEKSLVRRFDWWENRSP